MSEDDEGDSVPNDASMASEFIEQERTAMSFKDYQTVGCMHNSRGPFTYRIPQDLYDNVEEGDRVVVFNAYGYSVAEVVDKHESPQDTGDYNYRWAFQKVDTGLAAALDVDAAE